jgi:TonB family protein
MMKKIDWISGGITLLLHLLLGLLLWLIVMPQHEAQFESGVPVMLGNMGNLDTDYEFTEVESMPVPSSPITPAPAVEQAEPVITQTVEETVAIESGEEEVIKTEEVYQPTEAELRAEAERKAQEEADRLLANMFSQGGGMASTTEQVTENVQGVPGSVQGNSSTGAVTGSPSYGTWDLSGRDMVGELPRPTYDDVQAEGRVVVTIQVSPEGDVVSVSINQRTNTVNQKLQQAALTAAAKTKFNAIGGLNNQTGTITYYFKQR